MGDSGIARVAGRGKTLLKFTLGKSLALHSVLHVPNMCRNLVFGFLLNKAGLKIVFESNKIIFSQNGDFVGKGFCHEGLFVLETDCENMNISSNSFAYIVESLDLWHGRLGHVNVATIKRMKQMSLIPNLTNLEHSKCEICIEAKHFKKPFKTVERSSVLLELIHSDLGDFKNYMSRGGKKYYMTFIDDYSRYIYKSIPLK